MQRAVDVAQTHERLIQSRIEMMRGYAETTGCRRQYLLGYFGEQLPHRCGNCDTCDAGTADQQPAENNEFPVNSSVQHADWGHGVVMSIEKDRLTVLFDDVGYKTLSLPAIRERRPQVPGKVAGVIVLRIDHVADLRGQCPHARILDARLGELGESRLAISSSA